MSNKELAVQFLVAKMKMKATVASNPAYTGEVHIPSYQEMIDGVAELAEMLSKLDNPGTAKL